jgi:hypothetical protein
MQTACNAQILSARLIFPAWSSCSAVFAAIPRPVTSQRSQSSRYGSDNSPTNASRTGQPVCTFNSPVATDHFLKRFRYLDGSRYTLFEIMLSLSRKTRIIVASSWILGGVSGLHWSNRKPALTANSSSRSSLSGSSIKSIRCIFPATCAHTSKTVADMPEVNWIARASWAASFGLSASISISQITRNSKGIPRTAVEMNT